MKKLISVSICLILFVSSIFAQTVIELGATKKVAISVDQTDAKIYVNGVMVTTGGSTEIKIKFNTTTNVRVEKVGYITEEKNFVNNNSNSIPKSVFIKMEVDDAFNSSVSTDMANRDNEIRTTKSEEEAWKLISQIVTNYFDVVEVSDRNTGYMRTAWVQKTFKSATIRTRLIIKLGSSSPLTYKVKMVSEKAKPGSSIKDDEQFKEWDRLLRTYEPIINELQTRLGSK